MLRTFYASKVLHARLPHLLLLLATVLSAFALLAGLRRLSVDTESIATTEAMLRVWYGEPSPGPLSTNSPPGYPLLLTFLAQLIPGLRSALACHADPLARCSQVSLAPLLLLQLGAAMATLVLAHRMAHRLAGHASIALITVTLMYIATRPGSFAGMLRGQTWLVFLLFAHLLLLLESALRASRLLPAASGLALGAAIMFQPLAAALIPASAIMLALTPRPGHGRTARSLGAAVLLASAALASLAALLGLATALGYAADSLFRSVGIDLTQRLSFIGIKSGTALAIMATSVPVIGDLIATILPASELRLISVGGADGSLIHTAAAHHWPAALAGSGGASLAAITKLLREQVIAAPLAYLVSLGPVLMRGLFAGGGLVALIGAFHIGTMLAFARADGALPRHRLVFVPVLALLAVNVLLTGNAFWSNPLLPFVYAYAVAYVASGW